MGEEEEEEGSEEEEREEEEEEGVEIEMEGTEGAEGVEGRESVEIEEVEGVRGVVGREEGVRGVVGREEGVEEEVGGKAGDVNENFLVGSVEVEGVAGERVVEEVVLLKERGTGGELNDGCLVTDCVEEAEEGVEEG